MKKNKLVETPTIAKIFLLQLLENDDFRKIPKALSHSIIPKLQKSVDFRIPLEALTDIDRIQQDMLRPAAHRLSQSIVNEMQGGVILLSSILSETAPECTRDTVIYDDMAIRLLTYNNFEAEVGNKFSLFCRFDIGYSWCKI